MGSISSYKIQTDYTSCIHMTPGPGLPTLHAERGQGMEIFHGMKKILKSY